MWMYVVFLIGYPAGLYGELYWVNKKSTGAQTTTASLVGYSGLIGRFTLPQGVTVPGHINLSADKVFVTYESQTYQEADDFEVLAKATYTLTGSRSGPNVPPGAVIGGHTADGHPLYVVGIPGVGYGNHDKRNDYAEGPESDGTTKYSDWQFLVLGYEAHLVGAGFYQPFELLDRNATTNQLPNSATTDYNTFTCQRVVSSDGRSLQVIYNFPKNTNISHTMSVELKVKNSECSAWAWSWFVSGRCVKNSFMECSNKRTYSDATFSVCILTCPCLYSCDFLHLKFSRLQTKPDLDFSELCEVGLRLSDVEPPLKIF